MKWMLSTGFVLAVSVAMNAQSGKSGDMSMSDMHKDMTYSGCIEAVNHGASFMLTHLSDEHAASMKDDMMKKDMPDDHMKADHMMPNAFALKGRDLNKHVGQRVSVTGSRSNGMSGSMRDDLDTLTVSSLKVVAKSCM